MPTKEELTIENARLKKQASTLRGQVTKAKKELQNQAGYVADLERESAEVAEEMHTQLERAASDLDMGAAIVNERDELRRTVDENLLVIGNLRSENLEFERANAELADDNERLRSDVKIAREESLRAQQETKSKFPWAGILAIPLGLAVELIVAYVITAALDYITHGTDSVEPEQVA